MIRTIVALLAAAFSASAAPVTLDFEGLTDSSALTNQYANVNFTNAIVLTSGVSLNEFEFPPHSGSNVVSDNGGAIEIAFASPITNFSAYFTYGDALTIQAFNAANSQIASVTSAFSNNEALSGVSGSSPNEWLTLAFASGISSVTITGDPNGGSFVMDDVTLNATASPEPHAAVLAFMGLALLLLLTKIRRYLNGVFVSCLCMIAVFGNIAWGAPPPGTPAPSQLGIFVNQSTTLTIVSPVPADPQLIANSVNLVRLNDAGQAIANLGQMYDDGTHGDAVAGDGRFTSQITLLEPRVGNLNLVVSAAYRSQLARAKSPVASVPIVARPTGGSGTLTSSGGTLSTPAGSVTVPSGASLTDQNISINPVIAPSGLPSALKPVGAAVDITVDNVAMLNAPLLIKLPYDPAGIPDENKLAVVHYDASKFRYEPVTILGHDLTAHTFLIDSRTFSPFQVVSFANAVLDTAHSVTGFTPAVNGWNINNFGGYFRQGGNCLGMSAYAVWYFDNGVSPQLNGAFSAAGSPVSIAQLLAVRAHLAQSQYWAQQSNTYLNTLGPAVTGELMKMYLDVFDQPMILLLGNNGNPLHASVLYGYNAASFTFYDVNLMNQSQQLGFTGASFGTYGSYNQFTFVAAPSLGRTTDFAQLTAEAQGGFSSSSLMSVTSPTPGQQINGYSVQLDGALSGFLNANATVLAFVKGIQQNITTSGGTFSGTLPISNGDNTIVLLAGENIALQSNWFPNSAALILDVTGNVPTATLLTTLVWNQNNIDVDLYVTEPAPSGQTAWYADKVTSNLLALDFDNTYGFGPEHTTLTTTGTNPGTVLPGLYTIYVHYYSDHGTGQTATGTVSIVVNEGAPNQTLTSKSFTIAPSNPSNALPGSAGPDWVSIGTVDLIHGTIALNAEQTLFAPPQTSVFSVPTNMTKSISPVSR